MYDIIIIGAGTAGISAYKEAVKYTSNILIVNEGPWDTTCARVGCMPSKILISTANRMYDIQHTENVGLKVSSEIDTSQVMQHVQTLRDRFTRATLKDVESWPDEHKISGRAEFLNANTIIVNGQKLQAKSFIIAVGTTPTIDSEQKQKLDSKLLTSDQIFELVQLPKSIAVIGSGVIALELAQALHRLGVKTTIFARSRKIGSLTSPTLQKLAQEEMSKELDIKFEVLPEQFEQCNNQVKLTFTESDQQKNILVDYILAATGRRTLLNTLKLENIESHFTELKKIPIDSETKQLGHHPIFIVGDAYTNTPIQHEAAHEGRTAVNNCIKFPNISSLKTLAPIGILFSSPQMATIGQSYRQLESANEQFITGTVSYEKQGRALVTGKNKGAVEIYISKTTSKILGAELFCPDAEHLAHLLCWIMSEDLTINQILEKPFYHPTLEEGLRTALKHARRQLLN
ncbi:dihydrolipoyl dehydrogenase [Acinetobacter sp. ANC 5054]|uniref:dihydrolipoyl dehydrogenase n=1 Tax=Acinetobacter sp. ANC 5054 TaxID=1977877 RepID=UPI000A32CF40|nr:dihydrolipoyl dehydrogenase [Acinetobacter sp. ANC 5054]OTG80986.1 dihydrolipoyl dehydrogenase [Acinetobacter sp. ANC 5054]